MQTPDALTHVAEFHRTFKHPVLPSPVIPSDERCALRISLLAEELRELEEAIAQKDLVGIADALCDLQYVLSGAVLEFGLGELFKPLFEEVQRSNMSKTCQTREEAEATVRYYRDEKGQDCYYEASDGHYLVYRKSDQKTLKSVGYSPADLATLLAPYLAR